MANREINMREYASISQGRFLELLEQVMKECPEMFGQQDKSIAIGHISDMCADLFGDCIETADFADKCISGARLIKHGMSEGRAA